MKPDYLRVLETPPVREVVALLEETLARAKTGEVIGVGLAMSCGGRSEATAFAVGEGSIATLVLSTERLKARLQPMDAAADAIERGAHREGKP